MISPADIYANGIKRKLENHFAAWTPDTKIELGDVGTLHGNFFTPISNLRESEIGIQFDERPDTTSAPLEIQSSSGVNMTFQGSGDAETILPNVPRGEVGVGIEFGHEGAFVFEAPETFAPDIKNMLRLQRDIIHAYGQGDWEFDWAVVTRVVQAPSATVLVSESSQSKIEFSVQADISVGPVNLGKAGIGLSRRAQSGAIFYMMGATDVTPFFQLARINRWTWGIPDSSDVGVVQDRFMNIESTSKMAPRVLLTPRRVRDNSSIAESLRLELVKPPGIG
jgi:hypothetical protein